MVDDEAGDMSDALLPQMDPLMAAEGPWDQDVPPVLEGTNEGSELRNVFETEEGAPEAPLTDVLLEEDNGLSGELVWPDNNMLGGELRKVWWPGDAKMGEFKLMALD